MKEKAFTLDRGKRYLFYILMIAILGWFLFMQFFGADERSQEMSSGPVIYSGTFIWQKSDGTSEKITVILSILVDTFISKISLTMQPGPKIDSISGA